MPDSIHGHEIMRLMIEANPAYTRETLQQAVVQKYGEDVRFHACEGKDMTLDGLLEYLDSRGKLAEKDGQLGIETGQMCSCDEDASGH